MLRRPIFRWLHIGAQNLILSVFREATPTPPQMWCVLWDHGWLSAQSGQDRRFHRLRSPREETAKDHRQTSALLCHESYLKDLPRLRSPSCPLLLRIWDAKSENPPDAMARAS